MTIRRAPRPERYTVMPNTAIEDDRLSFKALGLLTYLLSKPDHWSISRDQLARAHSDGVAAVRTALRELRELGYIVDEIERGPDGKITASAAVVHATPQPTKPPPDGGKPARRSERQAVKPPLVNTEVEQVLIEATVVTHREQLALMPEVQPPAARRPEPLTLVGFDAFWRAFPLKAGKGAARRAWDRAIRRANAADIIAGAERYAADPNRSPQFTKYPQGWLNDDRWKDDPLPAREPSSALGRTVQGFAAVAAMAGGSTPFELEDPDRRSLPR